ncbi:MAG: hemerythrin domain-containing protein [Armatimonadota bacterium]
MRVTDDLTQDHRVIEVVLPVVDRLGREARQSRVTDRAVAEAAIDFLRVFADAFHHGKEELELFKAMERRGVRRDLGLVYHLLEEHGRGRKHVRALADSLPAAADGDAGAAATFASNAGSYVKLLDHHIREEDVELWPLALRVLSEDDDMSMMESFAEIERKALGEGGVASYRDRAAEIARRAGL